MRTLTVEREKSFVSCRMNYWIVLKYAKDEMISRDWKITYDKNGNPAAPADFNPNDYGTPIANGGTVAFNLDDKVESVFAVTMDGLFSNEIKLDPQPDHIEVIITTKGGWKTPGCPYLELNRIR